MTEIDTPLQLIKYAKDESINNVLIGNGFGLSHPQLNKCFTWDQEAISDKFSQEALFACLKERIKDPHCPETFLYNLRLYFVECILSAYIEKLCSTIDGECNNLSGLYYKYLEQRKFHAEDFLKSFQNVFTVNYDPLIYFEMLKLMKPSSGIKIVDGFIKKGDEFISQQKIVSALENNKKKGGKNLYFLHGSWFIQAKNREEDLRKISFSKNSNYKIADLFDWENKWFPCLIFEDRWLVKKALIKDCDYFIGCLDILQKTKGRLLVFGMSFNKDDHILKALKGQFEKIYFTYTEEKDKDSIEKKIKKINFNKLNSGLIFLQ